MMIDVLLEPSTTPDMITQILQDYPNLRVPYQNALARRNGSPAPSPVPYRGDGFATPSSVSSRMTATTIATPQSVASRSPSISNSVQRKPKPKKQPMQQEPMPPELSQDPYVVAEDEAEDGADKVVAKVRMSFSGGKSGKIRIGRLAQPDLKIPDGSFYFYAPHFLASQFGRKAGIKTFEEAKSIILNICHDSEKDVLEELDEFYLDSRENGLVQKIKDVRPYGQQADLDPKYQRFHASKSKCFIWVKNLLNNKANEHSDPGSDKGSDPGSDRE